MKGRADEACFHYLVVPSGRPALQLELEIRRQQFRLVEHNNLQCRGGCLPRCVGSLAFQPPARRFSRTAENKRLGYTQRTENPRLVGDGRHVLSHPYSKSEPTLST